MHKRCVVSAWLAVALVLVSVACTSNAEPTATSTPQPTHTSEPTPTPMPQAVSIAGPGCPEGFQENQHIGEDLAIGASGVLTLTLGSTPSIPCGWHPPEIGDDAVIRQVDHQSKWPAEGVTPMPGAPGTEIWVFETLGEGESTISLKCVCLNEEGSGEEASGVLVLNVAVKSR